MWKKSSNGNGVKKLIEGVEIDKSCKAMLTWTGLLIGPTSVRHRQTRALKWKVRVSPQPDAKAEKPLSWKRAENDYRTF
jgi:hypothetical protein